MATMAAEKRQKSLGLSPRLYAALRWASYQFGIIRLGQPLVESDLKKIAAHDDDEILREAPGLPPQELAQFRARYPADPCPCCHGSGRRQAETPR